MYLDLYNIFFPFLGVLSIISSHKNLEKSFQGFVFFCAALLFLTGSFRIDGVDMESYRDIYYDTRKMFMPDRGYLLIQNFFSFLNFKLEVFIFFMGLVTVWSIKRISNYFDINSGILMVFYLGHFAIVRDFAQIRVGLAVSTLFIIFTYQKKLPRSVYYLLFIIPISIHLSSIILFFLIVAWDFYKKKPNLFRYILPFLIIFIMGLNLNLFAILDSRILIYMNWDKYSGAVDSYNQIYLILIMFLLILTLRYERTNETQFIVFTLIASLVVFFSFFYFSIFAYRLTNLTISFYQILILLLLKNKNFFYKVPILSIFFIVYLLNPNTDKFLSIIEFPF